MNPAAMMAAHRERSTFFEEGIENARDMNFFAQRGEEAGEEHRDPRKRGVEHVVVRHLGRRPRAEFVGDQVERDLVSEEEGDERVADDEGQEDALRRQRVAIPDARDGELFREALAEEDFAGADDDDQQHGHADALDQRAENRIAPGTPDTIRSCCSRPARSGRSEARSGDEDDRRDSDAEEQAELQVAAKQTHHEDRHDATT